MLATIFLTVFIDLLGVGIIIPVLAPLFLDPMSGILPVDYQAVFFTRQLLLGLLISAYPLAQFFGAPILGAMSDRFGRRRVLLLSLIGTCIGYLFFGSGIALASIVILFISRIVDGFTGGNISIALSAIADISDPKEKAKNFGLIGMAFGLGFILGPYIGGKLADPTLVSWFTHSTPFWFAALLTLVNIFLVMFRFPETLKNRINTPISALTGFRNIAKACRMQNLRTMFIVVFLLTIGFNFFTQFFQVYLIEKFNYTIGDIGNLFAYIGLWIAFAQGFVTRIIGKKFSPQQIMSVSCVVLSAALLVLIIPDKSIALLFILPFVAVSNGLTQPNSTAIISNLSDRKSQGEILGINQSIQSLGMAIPPVIAGMIVTIDKVLPIFLASCFVFLAWIVFLFFFNGKKTEKFQEA